MNWLVLKYSLTDWKHLFQRYLPLPQSHADDRHTALKVDAYDPPGLVESRDLHRVVWLKPSAGFTERSPFPSVSAGKSLE